MVLDGGKMNDLTQKTAELYQRITKYGISREEYSMTSSGNTDLTLWRIAEILAELGAVGAKPPTHPKSSSKKGVK